MWGLCTFLGAKESEISKPKNQGLWSQRIRVAGAEESWSLKPRWFLARLIEGFFDGILLGSFDGFLLGLTEGFFDGLLDGSFDGVLLGLAEGFFESILDCFFDGILLGFFDGFLLGLTEGFIDGILDGFLMVSC